MSGKASVTVFLTSLKFRVCRGFHKGPVRFLERHVGLGLKSFEFRNLSSGFRDWGLAFTVQG